MSNSNTESCCCSVRCFKLKWKVFNSHRNLVWTVIMLCDGCVFKRFQFALQLLFRLYFLNCMLFNGKWVWAWMCLLPRRNKIVQFGDTKSIHRLDLHTWRQVTPDNWTMFLYRKHSFDACKNHESKIHSQRVAFNLNVMKIINHLFAPNNKLYRVSCWIYVESVVVSWKWHMHAVKIAVQPTHQKFIICSLSWKHFGFICDYFTLKDKTEPHKSDIFFIFNEWNHQRFG